jgi:hypothetical protein
MAEILRGAHTKKKQRGGRPNKLSFESKISCSALGNILNLNACWLYLSFWEASFVKHHNTVNFSEKALFCFYIV